MSQKNSLIGFLNLKRDKYKVYTKNFVTYEIVTLLSANSKF